MRNLRRNLPARSFRGRLPAKEEDRVGCRAPDAGDLTKEQLLEAYRVMRTIREFEERLHREFATGEIPGFVHLYAGEEAIAAGIIDHLDADDYVASTHRGHGHAIAKGCDVKAMMAEIYGKKTGSATARAARCTSPTSTRGCSAPTASSAAARRWCAASA